MNDIVNEYYTDSYLAHHGILGQKWGVRRFQNKDGSLTSAGQKRYEDQKKETTYREYRKERKLIRKDIHNKYPYKRLKEIDELATKRLLKKYGKEKVEKFQKNDKLIQDAQTAFYVAFNTAATLSVMGYLDRRYYY